MLAVAIGAYRRITRTTLNGHAMHALHKFLGDFAVALAAGLRNIEMKNRGDGIVGREDFMAAMTTAAGGGAIHSGQGQTAVYAAAVCRQRILDRDMMFFHQFRIGVAAAAGEGKLARIDERQRVCARANVMAAVAIAAGGRIGSKSASGLAMHTFSHLSQGIGVAVAANRWRKFFRVWNFRGIGMAGYAIESGMHGIFHLRKIDKQRTFRARAVGYNQACIAMAGKTVARLLRQDRRKPAKDTKQKDSTS